MLVHAGKYRQNWEERLTIQTIQKLNTT